MVKRHAKLKLFILEIIMVIASLIIIIPMLIMILGSFKDAVGAAKFNISLPDVWHFENFAVVIESGNLIRSFFNSVIIAGTSTAIGVLLSAMAAFVIARRPGKGPERLYNFFFIGMVAPMQIITTYLLLDFLHIRGTMIGVVMIYIAINLPFNIFMFTSFIRGIPRELDEAAIIDGCSSGKMFFLVILPLLKPVLATSCIILAMNVWNDFQIPLYFLNNSDEWTMPLTVYKFYGQYFSNWNYVFADMLLTALPILILYLFAQKYIINGMTSGAVKG
ncbi:carbohydrate ABC transporter permease [Mediterraneibacter glycyrrhizinilyticus]|uniref:carbohydrate ABC transporter permease n=1 Tax=Mediterraneibacter glycyrrhizinilyticus TaxID=342942 RepID=UPI00195FF16D|nr:carbohydrate ABC transporter permease [Mediterraneibacter glycyrrhizinilyticus]MBM6750566.1 carbohydrate ABC transporter permease [Mediterraneibacter glycyrrhizinilyticus]